MSNKINILSSLSCDHWFGGITYVGSGKDIRVVVDPRKRVKLEGGANVAQKGTLVTPKAVLVEVPEEDYEIMKQDPTFQDFVKDNYITVLNDKSDKEKALADMQPKDASAMLNDGDYEQKPEFDAVVEGTNHVSVDANAGGKTRRGRKPSFIKEISK